MNSKILILTIWLALVGGCITTESDIDFEEVSKGYYSGHVEPVNYVINTEEKWAEIWGKPEVDFSKYTVIAVFMGEFPTGGYDIEVKNIIEHEDKIVVVVKKTSPEPGAIVTQAFTQPYHIVKIGKTNKPVVFED